MAIPPGARQTIARAAAELASVPPFSELSPVDRARLAATLEEVSYEAGAVIFTQGARADALYILREGAVERLADGVRLDTIEPPAVFGDLALLRDEPRATTLRAVTRCVVWRLPADRFQRLLSRTPRIAACFAAAVGSRLASRQQEVAELAQEFQVMAEHLYASLSPREQQTLERVALLPQLDPRVLGRLLGDGRPTFGASSSTSASAGASPRADPGALPLADILLASRDGRDSATATSGPRSYPPAFRRFLQTRLHDRLGPGGLAAARRELAAVAREAGAAELAVQILLEGDLIAEAVELAEREVEQLRHAGRLDEARRLAQRLPEAALAEHPRLKELAVLPAPATAVAPAEPRRRWRLGRAATGSALAVLVLLGTWLLPPPAGLAVAGWHALGTLVAIVPLLALEAMPDGIVALLLATAWVVGGITSPKVALGGFATGTWVLVVTALAVGAAIASSGLLYRMALWTVAHARGGFAGQVIGLALAGMLIGPAVPNATSRVALVAPAVGELIDALGYPVGSPAAIGLAMAVLIGFGQTVGLFLTSSTTSVLVYAVLPEATRASVGWAGWAVRAAPTHLLLFAGLAAFIIWRFRPRASTALDSSLPSASTSSTDALALQQALLGPLSRHERIAVGVTLFVLLGFGTQPLHHIDPAWVGVVALSIMAGTGLLTANGLSGINWSFALLSGILTSMSDVFADSQLDRWLAGIATQVVGDLVTTPVLFVAALTGLCYALSLVLRWQAAAPLLTISLTPLGLSAGIDPWVIGFIALIACNGFFLPYQSTTYLALYHGTNGRLFSHREARPLALAYAVVTLLALCATVPIWRLMRLV